MWTWWARRCIYTDYKKPDVEVYRSSWMLQKQLEEPGHEVTVVRICHLTWSSQSLQMVLVVVVTDPQLINFLLMYQTERALFNHLSIHVSLFLFSAGWFSEANSSRFSCFPPPHPNRPRSPPGHRSLKLETSGMIQNRLGRLAAHSTYQLLKPDFRLTFFSHPIDSISRRLN